MVQVPFPIEYDVFQDGYTAVYGPVQSRQIQAVEALFSNGESARRKIEGLDFLIFQDEKADVCELRYFDSEDQLLASKVLSRRFERSDECPVPAPTAPLIDLASIGNPPVIGFAIEGSQGTVLDCAGCSFQILKGL